MAYKKYENQIPDEYLHMDDSGASEENLTKYVPQFADIETTTTTGPKQSDYGRKQRRQMGILYQAGMDEDEALVEAMKLSLAESPGEEISGASEENLTENVPQFADIETTTTTGPKQSDYGRKQRRQMGILYQAGKDKDEALAEAMKMSLAESPGEEISGASEENLTENVPQFADIETTTTTGPKQSDYGRKQRRQMGILYQAGKDEDEALAEAMKMSLAESSGEEIRESQEDFNTSVDETHHKKEIPIYDGEEMFAQAAKDSLTESRQLEIWEPQEDSGPQVDENIAQAMRVSSAEPAAHEMFKCNKREALTESGQWEVPMYNRKEIIAQEKHDIEQALRESLVESEQQDIPKNDRREAKAQAIRVSSAERAAHEIFIYNEREALTESGQQDVPIYNRREIIAQEQHDIKQALRESLGESEQHIPKYNRREAPKAQERKDFKEAWMNSMMETGQQEIRQPGSDVHNSMDKIRMKNEVMVGQTRVVLEQGQITKQKADALVNIVDPSGEFPGHNVVGKAFAKDGGSELIQNYKKKLIEKEDREARGDATTYKYITITESAGNLLCSDVIHVKLVRNKPQILKDVVRDIYRACSKNDYKVICLPPLGNGQMYGYPVEDVASCMLEVTCSRIQQGKLKIQEVRFVVHERDSETYMMFDSMLDQVDKPPVAQNQYSANRSKTHLPQLQINREFQQPRAIQEHFTTRQTHVKEQSKNHPSPKTCPRGNYYPIPFHSDTIHHSRERNQPHKTDQVLNNRRNCSGNTARTRGRSLESETRHSYEGSQDAINKPFRQDKDKQYRTRSKSLDRCEGERQQNKHSGLHGYAWKGNRELKLNKERESVNNANRDIRQILSDGMSNVPQTKRKRPRSGMKRGTTEFAKMMATYEAEVPEYWKHFQPGKVLKNVIVNLKRIVMKRKYAEVQLHNGCKTYKAILRFINETFRAGVKFIGQGKDASGIKPYRQCFVVKIERIENPELFTAYTTKRAEIFSRLCKKNSGYFPKLENVEISETLCQPIKSVCLGKDEELGEDLYEEVNEYYFFHGTKPEYISKICSDGLDYRLCSPDAMLGQGIYGAESVIKSDQYTDEKDDRTVGQKKMILMRMLLGNIFVCTDVNPHKYRRAPCTRCYMDDCTDERHHDCFDSVVGGVNKRFREFVVYDGRQCYPEYLITYERH